MTTNLDLEQIVVPMAAVTTIQAHLRERGRKGVEGVALWAGRREGRHYQVLEAVIPEQTAYQTGSGLLYRVEGDELHRINLWLREHGLTLIAQVHSHPGAAYHSTTDDEYPIVTKTGSLSIVVPNFAARSFNLNDCAVFRLLPPRGWVQLSATGVHALIRIQE